MYFRIGYTYPKNDDGGYYMIQDGIDFDGVSSWALGRHFEAALPNPILLELVPVSDFTGEPPDMFDEYMCLMSRAMVRAIAATGADNLDIYPAVLEDRQNGRRFDYSAVNIVGLVAAADLNSSEWENLDGPAILDTHFDSLVVDESKAAGHLIFRLAEDSSAIIVHEKVKDALEASGLATLTYTKVTS
jgi:hypothetical protein